MENITFVSLIKEWSISLGVILASLAAAKSGPSGEFASADLCLAVFIVGFCQGFYWWWYSESPFDSDPFGVCKGIMFAIPLIIQAAILFPLAWMNYLPVSLVLGMVFGGALAAGLFLYFGAIFGFFVGWLYELPIKHKFKR